MQRRFEDRFSSFISVMMVLTVGAFLGYFLMGFILEGFGPEIIKAVMP